MNREITITLTTKASFGSNFNELTSGLFDWETSKKQDIAVMTCLHGSERTYPMDEKLDVENPTPSFAIPVYPAYLVERGTEGPLLSDINVKDTSPPLCLVHAADDPWTASGSFLLAVEYKKRDIPCEVHVYAKGGHGFGMKKKGKKQVVIRPSQQISPWYVSSVSNIFTRLKNY